MSVAIEPPPTYALPIIGNPDKIKELAAQFNPLWLKWFIDLTAAINATGGAGLGTVTDVAVSVGDGIAGSVTDPTTTPVINLSLGAITPTKATITGAFGCNGEAAQTPYASGGAAPSTGATQTTPYGYTTAAQANEIITLVNNIRAALIANGIMS